MSFKSSLVPSLVCVTPSLIQEGLGTRFWEHCGQAPEGMPAQRLQVAQFIPVPKGLMLLPLELLCPPQSPPLIHLPSCTPIVHPPPEPYAKPHLLCDILRCLLPGAALVI